jgi:hypothetical protein
MRASWEGFPSAHHLQLREITSYSLNGWLFTLATILITSGSIFFSGLLLTEGNIAKLQIALVLYAGVAAFITGGMVPLTTIRARFSDNTIDSIKKVSDAAKMLVDEAIMLTGMATIFFISYSKTILFILLGDQVDDPLLFASLIKIINAVLLPGLLVLPFFTFRFAIVKKSENASYCRRLLFFTCFALLLGMLMSAISRDALGIAFGVGIALIYRGVLAYIFGRSAMPNVKFADIASKILMVLFLCWMLSFCIDFLLAKLTLQWIENLNLNLVLYVLFCAVFYSFRQRLYSWIILNLPNLTFK